MHLGSWKLSALVTFVCNTHDPATGAATDADSVPTYRVYEDETGTPLLTGSMALLDSSNTAGFYSEQITVSAANGFEQGKSYSIYISATVTGITATMSHNFQMGAAVDLTWILGTLLTETAGQLAGAFKKWFDVAAPVGTVNSIPNATAGAAGGLFIAGTNAATTITTALTTTFTGNLTGNVGGSVATVTDITTTAQAELTAVPAANAAPLAKLNWLYLLARNKITQTATTQLVRNNADSSTVGTSTVSDDLTTAIRGQFS